MTGRFQASNADRPRVGPPMAAASHALGVERWHAPRLPPDWPSVVASNRPACVTGPMTPRRPPAAAAAAAARVASTGMPGQRLAGVVEATRSLDCAPPCMPSRCMHRSARDDTYDGDGRAWSRRSSAPARRARPTTTIVTTQDGASGRACRPCARRSSMPARARNARRLDQGPDEGTHDSSSHPARAAQAGFGATGASPGRRSSSTFGLSGKGPGIGGIGATGPVTTRSRQVRGCRTRSQKP